MTPDSRRKCACLETSTKGAMEMSNERLRTPALFSQIKALLKSSNTRKLHPIRLRSAPRGTAAVATSHSSPHKTNITISFSRQSGAIRGGYGRTTWFMVDYVPRAHWPLLGGGSTSFIRSHLRNQAESAIRVVPGGTFFTLVLPFLPPHSLFPLFFPLLGWLEVLFYILAFLLVQVAVV